MSAEIIEELKREIEENFGRKVLTSRDCNDISDEIFLKLNERIHTNTLRRFFGLVNSPYKPSATTLNILARYCGFSSFADIPTPKIEVCVPDQFLHHIEIVRYFYSLFKDTKVSYAHDEVFLSQVMHIIDFINHNHDQNLTNELQKFIAKTKNGQDFYFEQCINIDKLNSYYGEGLRYYAKNKPTTEAQVFAHSLLSFRAWLNMDGKSLEKHYTHVKSARLPESVRPFVCGWYYAAQLYYAHDTGADPAPILVQAEKTHAGIKTAKSKFFPAFENTFIEALVLTGHYEEALYYLKDVAEKYKFTNDYYKENGFYQIFDILKAIAYSKVGQRQMALNTFEHIKPSEFRLLSRKYKSILYMLLVMKLKIKNKKIFSQLDALIASVGFVRFKEYMKGFITE